MHSPTLALTWQMWGRHRWGIALLCAGLVGLACFYRVVPAEALAREETVVVFALPLAFAFIYLAYIFSYAELGPGTRSSSFPAWMFTLPVPTSLLVLWPMLYGMLAMGLAWLVAAQFVLVPCGMRVPVWWPALGLAATLAWLQAVEWSPLGAVAKALLLGVVLTVLWIGLVHEVSQTVTLLLLTGFLPLAYGLAIAGVAQARQGERQAAPRRQRFLNRVTTLLPRRRGAFSSPVRAQAWCEWHRNGTLLPVFIGCWTLFMLAMVPFAGTATTSQMMLLNDAYFLPFLAPLLGAVLGKSDAWARPFTLSTHAATRPVTSGVVVGIKLWTLTWSLLAAWCVLAAITPLWIVIAGNQDFLLKSWRSFAQHEGPARAWTLVALSVVSLLGFTWLQLAGNLFAGLSGRAWVFVTTLLANYVLAPNLFVIYIWIKQENAAPEVLQAGLLSWLGGSLVLAKFLATAAAVRTTYGRGLFSWRLATGVLAAWLATAATLFTVNYMLDAGRVFNLLIVVALVLPLTRIAAAPLALEWNRHR